MAKTFYTISAQLLCALLLAQTVLSAPTETEPATSTESPSSTQASVDSTSSASSSSTTAEPLTNPMAHHQSNFTCYGRQVGYYADMSTECKIYHFCVLGDYNGEPVYQRVSYYCLNESVFDQQKLDCVEKISAPCSDSEKYYDESNKVLREAVHSTNTNVTSNHQ